MDPREEEVLQYREEHYVPFEQTLAEVGDVIEEKDPKEWWFSIYLKLRQKVRSIRSGNSIAEMEDFVDTYWARVNQIFLDAAKGQEEDTLLAAHEAIHGISDVFHENEEVEEVEIKNIPLSELTQNERLRIEESEDTYTISIYSKIRDQWYSYPIPRSHNGHRLLHKGGLPRVVLKIIAGAPEDTIEAELPLNDIDFLATGDTNKVFATAKALDVDPDGIEMLDTLDYQYIFNSRDLDLNGCTLSQDGLTFSLQALESARTGSIRILSSARGLYGTEIFQYDGSRLMKNRGLMRLLKTVAEGKAHNFEFLPLNKQIDLGIYWLVLARKLSGKEQAGEYLDRLYYLGQQTGQVREGEMDIFDVLERVHKEVPFFNFDSGKLDTLGLARWLSKKLLKQIDKFYRDRYRVPTYFPYQREEGDTEPYIVSLKGYTPNEDCIDSFRDRWGQFLSSSRVRHRAYKESLAEAQQEDPDLE